MNIYQKLVEVRKSVSYLKKEAKGEQYNYTGSSQVLYSLRAKMDEMGLLLIPRITGKEVAGDTIEWTDKYNKLKHTTTYFTELTMEFTWVNADQPEETITCPWYGQGVDIAGEKGVGKALTYAEKYFLLKFFNIATDKDDPDSFQAKFEDDKPQHQDNKSHQPKNPKLSSQQLGEIKILAEKLVGVGVSKQDSFNLLRLELGNFGEISNLTNEQATRAIGKLEDLLAQNEKKAV